MGMVIQSKGNLQSGHATILPLVLTYSIQMKMMNNGLEKAADKLTLMFLRVKREFFGYIGVIF